MSSLATIMQQTLASLQQSELQGAYSTAINGVRLFRDAIGNARRPLIYQSGIIVMLQGSKTLYMESHSVTYQQGDYLLLGVPLPTECEAFPENGKPILSLIIDVPPTLLNELTSLIEPEYAAPNGRCQCSLTRQTLSAELTDTCARLLSLLRDPVDTAVLGSSVVRELIYRVLTGPHGAILRDLTQHQGHYARVARALTKIHQQYAQPLSVDSLADEANMSPSAFHRAFRQVTMTSPNQYVKRLRLSKARDLINVQGKRVNDAALEVGYRSQSQFFREFKRYYQVSPGEESRDQ